MIYNDTYRQKDHSFTFAFCMDGEFVEACFKCVYNALLTLSVEFYYINGFE